MLLTEKLERRYREDASFKAVVDMLYKIVGDLHLEPGEVREAAMFAVYLHAVRNPNPVVPRVPLGCNGSGKITVESIGTWNCPGCASCR